MKPATATESLLLILLAVFLCLGLFFACSCEADNKPTLAIERTGTNMTIRFRSGAARNQGHRCGSSRPSRPEGRGEKVENIFPIWQLSRSL
jgi:hypothetical protein